MTGRDNRLDAASARLRHLPICPKRQLPIPYANLTDADGTPDFAVLDSTRVYRCAADRRCGICAQALGYWIAFLGGPASADNRAYLDPPMHEECAHAALALCPYLTRAQMKRRRDTRPEAGVPPDFGEDRPEVFVLYITRSYRYRVTADGVIFRPAPAVRTERHTPQA